MATDDEVLTIDGLAALLGYSPGTIKNKRSKSQWLSTAIEMPDSAAKRLCRSGSENGG